MTRTLLAAAVTLALVSPQPAGAAGAPPGTGTNCGWVTMDNPFSEGRTSGVLLGGPVVIADGADPRTGRITCSVQWGYRHGDPDISSATSVTTAGAVTLHPAPFEHDSYLRPNTCTSVEIDGAGTFYWDGLADEWSTSPLAYCELESPGGDDPFEILFDLANDVDAFVDEFFVDGVDPVVCPLFAAQAPGAGPLVVEPEGDVYAADTFVWDCPPYDGSR